jgi:hypothetical protein
MSIQGIYFELLEEYERVYIEVFRSGLAPRDSETMQRANLHVHDALFELRLHLERAAMSPTGWQDQSRLETDVFRAAEKFDDVLYSLVREERIIREWHQHQQNIQSIVGRWPGLPPKRLRTRGGQ